MSDCIFCKIARHEIPANIVHEDDECLAFHDLHPQAPVHVLVIPKAHVRDVDAAGPEHAELLGKVMLAAADVARRLGTDASGYRIVVNCGPDAGQSVDHLHAHVLGGRPMGWPPFPS